MRPVFIGGCPRSGTTLLGGLLGAHSRCLCIPEMKFKLHLMRDLQWSDGSVAVHDVVSFVEDSWQFGIWNTPITVGRLLDMASPDGQEGPAREHLPDTRMTFRQALEALVRLYARELNREEPNVWIDHTPGNIRNSQEFLMRFPDLKIVHLVRDGRAVVASVRKLDWGPNTIWSATRWWPHWLANGLAAELAIPDRVIRVRYEELVQRPREVMKELCRRLELEPEARMGERTEFRVPRFTRDQHRLVSAPPDPSRANAWRAALTAREVEIFESGAGDVLRSLGYDLVHGIDARRPTRGEKLSGHALEASRRLANAVGFRRRVRRGTDASGGDRRPSEGDRSKEPAR